MGNDFPKWFKILLYISLPLVLGSFISIFYPEEITTASNFVARLFSVIWPYFIASAIGGFLGMLTLAIISANKYADMMREVDRANTEKDKAIEKKEEIKQLHLDALSKISLLEKAEKELRANLLNTHQLIEQADSVKDFVLEENIKLIELARSRAINEDDIKRATIHTDKIIKGNSIYKNKEMCLKAITEDLFFLARVCLNNIMTAMQRISSGHIPNESIEKEIDEVLLIQQAEAVCDLKVAEAHAT